jgi:hypothetical protein
MKNDESGRIITHPKGEYNTFFIHKTKAPHFPLREGGAFVSR